MTRVAAEMFWDEAPRDELVDLRDVVDVSFRIECPCLPLDHAHALSSALLEQLPWLATEEHAGIHQIHGAESGNGWMRPQDPEKDLLHLSRRARLRLRVPEAMTTDAQSLVGARLDIGGFVLAIGEMNVLPLQGLPVVFARHVVADPEQDEAGFLSRMAAELRRLDVPTNKLLSGRQHVLSVPGGLLPHPQPDGRRAGTGSLVAPAAQRRRLRPDARLRAFPRTQGYCPCARHHLSLSRSASMDL
jgi:CRISPR-associated protein Cas6